MSAAPPLQTLSQILFSQGFGTRRRCAALIADGQVQVGGATLDDPLASLPIEGLEFTVQGQTWPYRAKALVMLHKPAGYECSAKPRHHPSILGLLPAPLRERGVQPVGRLDEDTTGLLLLTDDGNLTLIGALAAEATARAVVSAIYHATGLPGLPAARDLGGAL